jgi:hypothetical protein
MGRGSSAAGRRPAQRRHPGLLDTVIDTLAREATPAESTEATPEQINHAMAMRLALADVINGSTGSGQLANRIERVSAELVASLREQNQADGVA